MPVSRGFTLIEVLVTLVILMFGLLGIAGLMAKGQRTSFEAFQRHQALQMASEMAERLRANKSQADTYADDAQAPAGVGAGSQFVNLVAGTCTAAACTAAELAAYDIAMWDGLLQGYGEIRTADDSAAGGIVRARGCIEKDPAGTPANTYRVSVAWQGNDNTGIPANRPSTCGTGLYGGEGLRRLVSIDVLVF